MSACGRKCFAVASLATLRGGDEDSVVAVSGDGLQEPG